MNSNSPNTWWFWVIVLFIFFPELARSQDAGKDKVTKSVMLTGKVMEEGTGKGLPFVSIYLIGSDVGTISSATGDFELRVDERSSPYRVVVSCVGYRSDTLALENQKAIFLTPQSYELPSIEVGSSRLDARGILNTAIQRIEENFDDANFSFDLYGRSTGKNFDSLIFDLEFVADSFYPSGYASKEAPLLKVKQLKRNLSSKKSSPFMHFERGALHAKQCDMVKINPLFDQGSAKHFKLELKSVIEGTPEIYVIDFLSLKKSYRHTGDYYDRAFNGTVFINADDYAVVRCEMTWERDTAKLNSLSRKYLNKGKGMIWDKQLNRYTIERIVTYKKSVNGKYYLQRGVTHWIEEGRTIKKSIPFKLKSIAEMFVSEIHSPATSMLTERQDEVIHFNNIKYDQLFWTNYSRPLPHGDVDLTD